MNGETKHPMSFPVALSDDAAKLVTGPHWKTVRELLTAEREACARIAEGRYDGWDWQHPEAAEAIRNRSK